MSDSPRLNVTAADVMTASPRSCSPFSTVLEAVMIFRDADCGAVPVVDAGEAVGILTDRDVALALGEHPDLATLAVADVMHKGAVSVAPSDPIESVAAKFDAGRLQRLLVVDSGQILCGIIARSDLAWYFPERVGGRFVPEAVPPTRVTGSDPSSTTTVTRSGSPT